MRDNLCQNPKSNFREFLKILSPILQKILRHFKTRLMFEKTADVLCCRSIQTKVSYLPLISDSHFRLRFFKFSYGTSLIPPFLQFPSWHKFSIHKWRRIQACLVSTLPVFWQDFVICVEKRWFCCKTTNMMSEISLPFFQKNTFQLFLLQLNSEFLVWKNERTFCQGISLGFWIIAWKWIALFFLSVICSRNPM